MAYSNIDKPSKYFNTILHTGNNTNPYSFTGVGFQPDFIWGKGRNNTFSHALFDSVRGVNKYLSSNGTSAEITNPTSGYLSSFNSDGFTAVAGTSNFANFNDNTINTPSTYVFWNWLANGAGVSNTAGSISSTVSANTTSGFSIVTWSGSGTNDQTIGHGLGVAPSFIIHKNRTYGSGDATGHWIVKTKDKINSSGSGSILYLNQTNAYSDNVHGTLITSGSTLLQVKGGSGSPSDFWVNASGSNYVAYCFAEVKGFSKAFSYTGNGSTDGVFTYCGFRPAWILLKKSDGSTQNWVMHDSKRNTYNLSQNKLFANLSDAEGTDATNYNLDILSNGFKLRSSNSDVNSSGGAYIGFAIAESPFVSSKGVPVCAR